MADLLKLNLGSGQRPFGKPWLNVDKQATHKPDVEMDAEQYLGMLPDGSIDMICLHHVIEHVGCGEADGLLKECHRVLAPRGSLLVFVPNMTALFAAWNDGRIDNQILMTNIYGAYQGDEADRHKWGYTYITLKDTLHKAGFIGGTGQFDWRQIPGADIAKDWWILGMEAIK